MTRWTRRETPLALNLYFETPFGKQHKTYPPIVELARKLGRTPSSIGMKLCNFTSLDPVEAARGIKGLDGSSKLDREIWDEFRQNQEEVVLEIELLLEQLETSDDQSPADTDSGLVQQADRVAELDSSDSPNPEFTESTALVKLRRHQNFFRRIVLRSYDQKCCITGNPIPELLRASHIVPWSVSKEERLNPRNGLCLSATFDAAFDRGLIAIDNDYRMLLSDRIRQHLPNERLEAEFVKREGVELGLPEKNLPDTSFLQWHCETVFYA